MTHPPPLSVVMPVFNAEPFVRAAVESVLAQTYADFELLAYDDGSTDRSLDILNEYARTDARVRVFPMAHQGLCAMLNAGLSAAAGPWVARMDADDTCLPRRFERQIAFLEDHPEVVAVGSDYERIDVDGDLLEVARHETRHEALIANILDGQVGVIGHPTIMARHVAVLRAGAYAERYDTTEDLDLWLRLAKVGRLANIPEVLYRVRHHGENVTYRLSERQQPLVAELINNARSERGFAPLPASMWSGRVLSPYEKHLMWGWWALRSGHRATARKHARLATSRSPWRVGGWALRLGALPPGFLTRFVIRAAAKVRRFAG